MPQVFVYIRKADMDKWNAIEKKSEFIHNALSMQNARSGAESFVIAESLKQNTAVTRAATMDEGREFLENGMDWIGLGSFVRVQFPDKKWYYWDGEKQVQVQ